MSTTVFNPLSNMEGSGVTDLQLREVFQRAGIGMEIPHEPAERAMINADRGIDDRTFSPVSGLSGNYPNLVMVPQSIMDFDFVAISKTPKMQLEGWDSLLPHSLGFITKWKTVEDDTKKCER